MIKKRTALLLLLSASFGFIIHDSLRDIGLKLYYRTQLIPNKSSAEKVLGQASTDRFIVRVTYDGTSFHPKSVTTQTGNYIVIANNSPSTLMWITSELVGLSTNRGYAEGEQIQYMVKAVGSFTVHDKLNPHATLTLLVHE